MPTKSTSGSRADRSAAAPARERHARRDDLDARRLDAEVRFELASGELANP